MTAKLIILRGNAASGKTTIAKALQNHFGRDTLVVSQDVVRRDMLKAHDKVGNLSIDLIYQIAAFGKDNCAIVIVEGILNEGRYGGMLRNLIAFYDEKAHTYYFDLPFEETVKRHNARAKKNEFGEDALQAWWNPNDHLDVAGEMIVTEAQSQQEIVSLIIEHVNQ
ncbi:kinase [Paraliobacillus ryukyuensis]|uniref:kinase n=1 Tax=Paraliobacillus ryukyuensis TaxID=200904 RepID=UPI0009A72370|nr:kinase [Paraliobacillus ryukyuensis]